MKKLILAASLVLSVSAYATSDKSFGMSDFERSLMGENKSDASIDSSKVEASSSSDFEQSLMGQSSSEMEPVYRAREDLLDAIRNKDTATVSLKVAQLEGMQTHSIIPLHDTEKLCFYKDLKMYRALLKMLVHHYKSAYEFDKTVNAQRAENDGLMVYTKDYLEKHKISNHDYQDIESNVNRSDLSEAEKSELKLLMNLHFAYKDDSDNASVRNYAKEFVDNFPDHPDASWVKKSILDPLNRMDVSDLYYTDRAEKKESVIENKLYTGGFGLNLYLSPGLGFGFGNYYREDLVKPESYPINFELYLQIRRVSVSFEMINSGHEGLINFGFSFGFVAYDSRYLKVRPYLGFSGSMFNGTVVNPYYFPKDSDYGLSPNESFEHWDMGSAITIGANVDFKFGTAYLFLSNSKLVSFSIVGKVGLSYLDLSDGEPLVRGSGLDAFLAIGLGVYFW